jgi:cytochrome c biogenesis protein CcdA
MIPQKQKEKLYEKMRQIREVIANGTLPVLIITTITLALFTSFIELLCTSGFPVLYTSVLSTKHAANSMYHYYYLALYSLIYVMPLLIIIGFIGFFLESKQISKKQTGVIKFISGMIMIILGLVLLIRPELVV